MYKLRDYQARTVKETWAWFRENVIGNPLLVLPTGSGKSLIIAQLIKDAIGWSKPDRQIRVLMVTHSKELIEQNHEKFTALCPELVAGIYSASLKSRDCNNSVIFAGIHSIYNKDVLGAFDLIVVDEAHSIPDEGEGMYRTYLNHQRELNPHVRVIGLTATPYRLSDGLLYGEGKLFDEIASEVSILELLELGYLSPIVSFKPAVTVDMKGCKLSGGDFNKKEAAERMMQGDTTATAMDDVLKRAADRKSWLIFTASVQHAYEVADYLLDHGISCEVITGETPQDERARIIELYKEGKIRAIANCAVLTTGFDAPATDCIVMMKPTKSTSLYQQMAGRGMRLADGKEDCLLLSYDGNIERHGCLDDPDIWRGDDRPKGQGTGVAPTKVCWECERICHAAVRECPACGFEFPKAEPKLELQASKKAVLSTQLEPILESYRVTNVSYTLHKKRGKPDSVKVTYFGEPLDGEEFFGGMFAKAVASEWLCFEHDGYAAIAARKWWSQWVCPYAIPTRTYHALSQLNQGAATRPTSITVNIAPKHPKIVELR